MKKLLFYVLFSAAAVTFAMTDSEWEQIKAKNLAKRRLIVNNDGCDAVNFPKNKEITVENFYAGMLDKLKGSQITTLSYCPGAVGFTLISKTSIGDRQLASVNDNGNIHNITTALEEKFGKDPMQLAKEFAAKNKLEFWGCMRINDVHDAAYPNWLGSWKKTHPEYLCGTKDNRPPHGAWTAYDFAQQAVRDRFTALCEEMMRNYDVDGFEIDFCRNINIFKSAAWGRKVSAEEKQMLTGMMRDIRAKAEKIARERKRPLVIGIRCPDSAAVCNAAGIDIEKWMKEGLFDLFFAGSDDGHFSTKASTFALCNKYKVQYYPSIDFSWLLPPGMEFRRNTIESFDAQLSAGASSGAKGFYFFNMFYAAHYFKAVPLFFSKLENRSKSYFVSYQRRNFQNSLPLEIASASANDELHHLNQAWLYKNMPKNYTIEIGREHPELNPDTVLYIASDEKNAPGITFNGQTLEAKLLRKGVYAAKMPATLPKKGINTIILAAPESHSSEAELILKGDKILAGANQFPWRRLYAGNGFDKNCESITPGQAYYLRDNLTENNGNGIVNLFYPLNGIAGQDIDLEFSLKVDSDSEEQSAVLRFANDKYAEIIDFAPDKINLVYNKFSYDFLTTEMTSYKLALHGDILTLSANGKGLFSRKLTVKTNDSIAKLGNYKFNYRKLGEASLIIGSLSGKGKGGSAWKDIRLVKPYIVKDLVLSIKYPFTLDENFKKYEAVETGKDLNADFSAGVPPQGIKSTYAKVTPPEGVKGMFLDNEIGQKWHSVGSGLPFMQNAGEALIVEYSVTPVRLSKEPEQAVFMMSLRPKTKQGNRIYMLNVSSKLDAVITPWGEFPIPEKSRQNLKVILRTADGVGAVYLDGKLLASGTVSEYDYPPNLLWGDNSSSIGGAAIIHSVKATLLNGANSNTSANAAGATPAPASVKKPAVLIRNAAFGSGKVPGHCTSTYLNAPLPAGEKGLMLDNEKGQQWHCIKFKDEQFLLDYKNSIAVDYIVKPVRPSKKEGQAVFQMVMRAPIPGKKNFYSFVVRSKTNAVVTPWGEFPTEEFADHNIRMVLDLKTGEGSVYLNGKLLKSGKTETTKYPAALLWGDVSSEIGGAAVIKHVKITAK